MPIQEQIAGASPEVRVAVRGLLSSCQAYHDLPPEDKRSAAQAMVKVCQAAVSLMQEEARADLDATTRSTRPKAPPVAVAQSAQPDIADAASKVAGVTRDILNAVSFPRFVTELITGVFRALVDSNRQQMAAYVDLIKNVAATVDGFAEMNLGPDQSRAWLVDAFPGSFVIEGGADADTAPEDRAEENESARLRLRDGASMPSEQALRAALGLTPAESVPSGDPETSLVPFARRAIARQRQQMLATMVQMGMQRIVIESGRLHAAMRFHIDTRNALAAASGSKFNLDNEVTAKGGFKVGPWGADASIKNTIGYVSTQKQTSSEEMNTDLDLNSSVELVFKTDYVPLDRMAGKGQVDRIKVNTLNPDAEEKIASQERQAREQGARTADQARDKELDSDLNPPSPPAAKPQPAPPAASPAGAKPANKPAGAGAKATPNKPKPSGQGKTNAVKSAALAHAAGAGDGLAAVSLFEREPLQEQCGFFAGQNAISEAGLRNALGQAALDERANWFDAAANSLAESDNSQFGHLVRYWLARFGDIRPDTFTAAQGAAIGGGINYGQLLVNAATAAAVTAAVRRVRADLLAGAPGVAAPGNLNSLVEQALRGARFSRMDDKDNGPWSAAFIVFCVRQAAIQLGLESNIGGNYIGQDALLLAAEAHRFYVAEAYRRRFGPNPVTGTYHAFRPSEAAIQIGDIIVQDRQSRRIADVIAFDRIPTLATQGYALHCDIVVELLDAGGECVTIGGNLGNSVRRRRYPLSADGRVLSVREQLYTQEDANGNLAAVPSVNAAAGLHDTSTGRIFAVLSPIEFCATIPGQDVNDGEVLV